MIICLAVRVIRETSSLIHRGPLQMLYNKVHGISDVGLFGLRYEMSSGMVTEMPEEDI